MLVLSSLAARLAVIGGSAVIHLTVFAAFAGHGASANDGDLAPTQEILIETLPTPEPPPQPEPVALPEPPHVHEHEVPHTHVHSYPVAADHDDTPHDPSIVHPPLPAAHDDEPTEPASPAPAAAVVEAPGSSPAKFTLTVGAVSVAHGGSTSAHGTATPSDEGGPVPEASVSIPAKLVHAATPAYPASARADEIEADVPLEIVIDQTGTVTDARVVRSVGNGFDDAALTAIRSFRFSPAQREGRPVRVRMKWSVVFRLQ